MKALTILTLLALSLVNGQIFLSEGKEEEKDQMAVEYMTNTGPDGGSILCFPKELSSDKKHGVVVWGTQKEELNQVHMKASSVV